MHTAVASYTVRVPMHLLLCYACMRAVQMCMLARAARYRNFPAFSTVAVTNRLKTIDLCIAPIDYVSITVAMYSTDRLLEAVPYNRYITVVYSRRRRPTRN